MSQSVTETARISDVVAWEQDIRYSREKRTVLDGEVMKVGRLANVNAAGKMVEADEAADEVQTLAITGTLTAGSFTLEFVDKNGAVKVTDPIAFNANIAAIQTGVDSALGASMVTVGGTAITATTLTFDGVGYTGKAQEIVRVDTSGLTGEEDATVTRTTEAAEGQADAVCLEDVSPVGADGEAVFLVRDAILKKSFLTAKDGEAVTADQLAGLERVGIITRDEAPEISAE
jgi:hypothetical protein